VKCDERGSMKLEFKLNKDSETRWTGS